MNEQAELFAGLVARDRALGILEQSQPEWLAMARAVARDLASSGGVVTVNDVREKCPPPPGSDPRIMGAIFNTREWERVGVQRSGRRVCHARPISTFRLKGIR